MFRNSNMKLSHLNLFSNKILYSHTWYKILKIFYIFVNYYLKIPKFGYHKQVLLETNSK